MGGGSYSANTYAQQTQAKIKAGTNFGYSRTMSSAPASARKAHPDLDPKKVAGPASPYAGKVMRESRDSVEHPNSVPIALVFDDTGSMGQDAYTVQKKLGSIYGMLLRKGYVEDPQLLTAVYADAITDTVPLQVAQFESDNRIDDSLDKVFIEGNGGGNGGESQALGWYYLAYHTATDAWEKRQKKGYAFFIADEVSHQITADQVRRVVGDGEPLGDIALPALAKTLQEKWEVYVLVLNNMTARMQGSVEFYTKHFGKDNVLVLETSDAVAETVAAVIGLREGTVDADDVEDDLIEAGTDLTSIKAALKATKDIALRNGTTAGGTVSVSTGAGATRL